MNILLSFAGDKTSIVQYFKHAIGNTGKIYTCDSMLNFSLTQADGYLITPHEYDDSYITALTDYCKKNSISAIIPLSDADLSVLSKNKNKLHDIGISAIVSDEPVIDICIDKWNMYIFLKSIGVKQPTSYIDLEAAKRDIEEGTLSFPLFLKPRFPHLASNKTTSRIDVYSFEELDFFYHKMEQTNLNVSDLLRNKVIIIQEIKHGDQYGVCIFNDLKGNYVTASALKKLSLINDETTFAIIEEIKPFEHVVNMFINELKHVANLEIDCCLLDSGDVIVFDIYARFGSHYPFWHVADADFPKQIVDWLHGHPLSPNITHPVIGVNSCKEWGSTVLFDYEHFK